MQKQILLQGLTPEEFLIKIDTLLSERINELTHILRKSKYEGKPYLTGKEVDRMLSITPPTRYEWEKKGLFSRYKVSGRTRYKRTEIVDALIKQERKRA